MRDLGELAEGEKETATATGEQAEEKTAGLRTKSGCAHARHGRGEGAGGNMDRETAEGK